MKLQYLAIHLIQKVTNCYFLSVCQCVKRVLFHKCGHNNHNDVMCNDNVGLVLPPLQLKFLLLLPLPLLPLIVTVVVVVIKLYTEGLTATCTAAY